MTPSHRSALNRICRSAGAVLLGGYVLFAIGALPSALDVNGLTMPPVRLAWVFLAYQLYALTVWLIIQAGDAVERCFPSILFWQRLVLGAVAIPLALGLVMMGMLMPQVPAFSGSGYWAHQWRSSWVMSSFLGVAVFAIRLSRQALKAQADRALHAQLDADLLATRLNDAELSALEAQTEPHFLFNTLAHIQHQYAINPEAGDAMLGDLTEYMERMLPALRQPGWTLGDELHLIRLYLRILSRRFGQRLRYAIECPEALFSLPLPALTLTTLVENAVQHGLSPMREGGTLQIAAQQQGPQIRLSVTDDGVGLQQTSGHGLGLASVRARLRAAYRGAAQCRVEPGLQRGVCATVTLPAGGEG